MTSYFEPNFNEKFLQENVVFFFSFFGMENLMWDFFFILATILKRFNRFELFSYFYFYFLVLGSYWIALSIVRVPVKEPNGKVVSKANKIMGPRAPPPLPYTPTGGHKTLYT